MTPDELKNKLRIATDWFPRYTGMPLNKCGRYVLLTNFFGYLREFAEIEGVGIHGTDKPMQAATAKQSDITMINFGIGAPNAVLICDLLSAVPWGVRGILFLGKCGGLQLPDHQLAIGDYILPIAAIRGEGTSDHYYPKEVPALPSFQLQKEVAAFVVANKRKYHSGMIYTTNRRLWEHDEQFQVYLRELRCIGIEMETAALFIAAFSNHIPHGALLLVSDLPLVEAKTEASDAEVTANHVSTHLKIGMETMAKLAERCESVRHFDY